jgi:hypothetical protein
MLGAVENLKIDSTKMMIGIWVELALILRQGLNLDRCSGGVSGFDSVPVSPSIASF